VYAAVVSGIPSPEHDVIDAPIEREAEEQMKRVVREDGKRAVTEYQVLKELDGGNSLCEITLHTGRTHQIRVHMAYIGHPLYADLLYGERIEGQNYLLHAKKITFIHPITEEPLILESKADFE
jgi:23S rRNA pseudouridine1911/1915/1917 synthase